MRSGAQGVWRGAGQIREDLIGLCMSSGFYSQAREEPLQGFKERGNDELTFL